MIHTIYTYKWDFTEINFLPFKSHHEKNEKEETTNWEEILIKSCL